MKMHVQKNKIKKLKSAFNIDKGFQNVCISKSFSVGYVFVKKSYKKGTINNINKVKINNFRQNK